MTCPKPDCGQPMAPDVGFARDMLAMEYPLPQRRWVCPVGHSVTLGVSEGVAFNVLAPTQGTKWLRTPCRHCHKVLGWVVTSWQRVHRECRAEYWRRQRNVGRAARHRQGR